MNHDIDMGIPTPHKTGDAVDELIVLVNGVRINGTSDDELDDLFFDELMRLQTEAIIDLDGSDDDD